MAQIKTGEAGKIIALNTDPKRELKGLARATAGFQAQYESATN
jgi:hypothetical protein